MQAAAPMLGECDADSHLDLRIRGMARAGAAVVLRSVGAIPAGPHRTRPYGVLMGRLPELRRSQLRLRFVQDWGRELP
jgi:hypothetical protein